MSRKMMTQKYLTKLLSERGWEVIDHRTDWNERREIIQARSLDPMLDMRKGISMFGISPSGYVLSLQAGAHNYSNPRSFAEEYENLEFAIWRHQGDNGAKDGAFIRDYRLHEGDDVVGWADLNHVMKAIKLIESWTPDNGPVRTPLHRTSIWDMGDK